MTTILPTTVPSSNGVRPRSDVNVPAPMPVPTHGGATAPPTTVPPWDLPQGSPARHDLTTKTWGGSWLTGMIIAGVGGVGAAAGGVAALAGHAVGGPLALSSAVVGGMLCIVFSLGMPMHDYHHGTNKSFDADAAATSAAASMVGRAPTAAIAAEHLVVGKVLKIDSDAASLVRDIIDKPTVDGMIKGTSFGRAVVQLPRSDGEAPLAYALVELAHADGAAAYPGGGPDGTAPEVLSELHDVGVRKDHDETIGKERWTITSEQSQVVLSGRGAADPDKGDVLAVSGDREVDRHFHGYVTEAK